MNEEFAAVPRNIPGIAAGSAGLASFGVMNIDLRKRIDKGKLKHLRVNKSNIRKYLKPGDILVGSVTTPDSSIEEITQDIKNSFRRSRKKGQGVISSARSAAKDAYIMGPASKISDPTASHVEYVTGRNRSAYIGGGKTNILKESFGGKTRKGTVGDAHFTILRPIKKNRKLNRQVRKLISKGLASTDNYSKKRALSAAVYDWLTPKFKVNESVKSVKTKALEQKITKGYCSTLAAIAQPKTVGGKSTRMVLPIDYLKSKEWKAVATIGDIKPGHIKTKLINKMIFRSPKILTQGSAALAISGLAGGLAKKIIQRSDS